MGSLTHAEPSVPTPAGEPVHRFEYVDRAEYDRRFAGLRADERRVHDKLAATGVTNFVEPAVVVCLVDRDNRSQAVKRARWIDAKAWDYLRDDLPVGQIYRDDALLKLGWDNFTIGGVPYCCEERRVKSVPA